MTSNCEKVLVQQVCHFTFKFRVTEHIFSFIFCRLCHFSELVSLRFYVTRVPLLSDAMNQH